MQADVYFGWNNLAHSPVQQLIPATQQYTNVDLLLSDDATSRSTPKGWSTFIFFYFQPISKSKPYILSTTLRIYVIHYLFPSIWKY